MKKIAVVTGSRRGIGLGIVKALSGELDCLCVVSDIIDAGDPQVAEVLAELKGLGFEADYVKCDISKASDRENLANAVAEKYGRIDILVNNAGVPLKKRMSVLETTEESFDFVLDINLKGTFFMCQTFANKMIECQKKGLENYAPRIVNISSCSAYTSSTQRGEYCISKAGIAMVTLLFADILAEYGIPVFEVRPGIIMSDMTAVVKEKYEKMIAEGVTPIKRFGQPEDVASCVVAACTGYIDFGTGTVLNADGGFHIRRL